MKSAMFSVLLCAVLTACATTDVAPEPQVVIQKEYIVAIPDKELLAIPPKVDALDTSNPNLMQSDVAVYLAQLQARMSKLENQIIGINQFLDKRLQETQVKK